MSQAQDRMLSLVQDVILSYEARISVIGTLIDNTYGIMHESKAALGRVSSQLRETLADRASFRKKDYDGIVARIESYQDERQREIRGLLAEFILVHRRMASELRALIASAQNGETVDLRAALADIQTQQDEVQTRVANELERHRNDQDGFMVEMCRLLDDCGPARVRDFKAAMEGFTARPGR